MTCFLKSLQITQLRYVDHFSNRLKPAHKYSPEQDARFEVVQGFLNYSGPHNYLSASDSDSADLRGDLEICGFCLFVLFFNSLISSSGDSNPGIP